MTGKGEEKQRWRKGRTEMGRGREEGEEGRNEEKKRKVRVEGGTKGTKDEEIEGG